MRPARPRGKASTTAMNSPPIANSHSCGKLSENSVLPQLTSSVPSTAPTSECRPPTAQKITISIDGTMPTNEGDMKPTCRVNIAPPIAAIAGGEAEDEDLEVCDVVAGEAHPVLLVAHRDQDAPELAVDAPRARAASHASSRPQHDEIEDVFGVVGADVPAEQRAQVGDAVDAAGIALLADDQDRHDGRQRLGDDGEIDAADAPLEHRDADDEGQQRRHRDDGDDRERQRLETAPRRTAAR